MIIGTIRQAGDVWVLAEVWLPDRGARRELRMRVDTGADRTTLSLADLRLDPEPAPQADDAVLVSGAGGTYVAGRAEPAMIRLRHDSGPVWATPISVVLLDAPPGHARLGLDVLRQLLVVIDPGEAAVRMEPLV